MLVGAGVDYKEIQPDILSASFKSSLSEFGVPRQMGFTALSFQAFSSEGTLVVFRRCHGNVTQWKTMFLERTWENMGANRAGATIPVLRRCQTRWRSSLLSPWRPPSSSTTSPPGPSTSSPCGGGGSVHDFCVVGGTWGNCGSG